MVWKCFLEEIADQASLVGSDRDYFLRLYQYENTTEFRRFTADNPYETLDFTSRNSYDQMLSRLYKKLRSPNLIPDLPSGKGRKKEADPNYIKVHHWLRKRYEQWSQENPTEQVGSSLAIDYGKKFHGELKELIFKEEEGKFSKRLRRDRCVACLIQTTGEGAQHWLTYRCAEQMTNFYTSERAIVNLKNRFLGSDLDELWRALECHINGFNLSDNSEKIIHEAIDNIVEKCITKNVLIVLYGVHKLKNETWYTLIHQFWDPLKTRMRDAGGDGKCVLLMAANCGCSAGKTLVHEPFSLEEILKEDWDDWILSDSLKSFWVEAKTVKLSHPIFPNVPIPGAPQDVLEHMCSQLTLEDDQGNQGIDFMKHRIWNLLVA